MRSAATRLLSLGALVLAVAALAPAAALADGGTATKLQLSATLAANAAFPGVLTAGEVRYREEGARRRIEVAATGQFAAGQQLLLVVNGLPAETMTASAIPGSLAFSADTEAGDAVPTIRAGATVQIWSSNLLFAFGAGVFS